jgi:hypothetical protein
MTDNGRSGLPRRRAGVDMDRAAPSRKGLVVLGPEHLFLLGCFAGPRHRPTW